MVSNLTNYNSGANFERKVKKHIENKGYYVMRSAGSKGSFDLFAVKKDSKEKVSLIQCKNRKPTKEEMADIELAQKDLKREDVIIMMVWPEGKELIWNPINLSTNRPKQ